MPLRLNPRAASRVLAALVGVASRTAFLIALGSGSLAMRAEANTPTRFATVTTTTARFLVAWEHPDGVPTPSFYDTYVDGTFRRRIAASSPQLEVTGLANGSTYAFTVAPVSSTGVVGSQSAPWFVTTKEIARDAAGWSILPETAATRKVYVSSSQGDDANDGLSPATPVKTIAAGATKVREGFNDHLLLRRGDTWKLETLGRFKSGRSEDEPIVVASYGDSGPRPVLMIDGPFFDANGAGRANLWFVGLDFYQFVNDPSHPEFTGGIDKEALRFVGVMTNYLVEDCVIRFAEISSQGCCNNDVTRNLNFTLRRSIIIDNWTRNNCTTYSERPSGIYVNRTDNVLIEENVFDHNGWNEFDYGRNQYNHNIYMQDTNSGRIILRGNIMTRASATGAQMRSGGLVEDNLFVSNPVAIWFSGNVENTAYIATQRIMRRNVILEAESMGPCQLATSAVWGIDAGKTDTTTKSMLIERNIVAHVKPGTPGSLRAIRQDSTPGRTIRDNIIHKFRPEENLSNPGWVDPERSIGSYQAQRGAEPTTLAFIQAIRSRGPREWPVHLTAKAVNQYIRDGFRLNGEIPVSGVSLAQSRLSLRAGQTSTLAATVTPANATRRGVTWESDNPGRLVVDASGGLVARSPGSARVRVITDDLQLVASTEVVVFPATMPSPVTDADGDGLADFLEFALGSDPQSRLSSRLPRLGTTAEGPALVFTRASAEVTYTVEGSQDLASWAPLATFVGGSGQEVSVPVGTASFVRLRALVP